MDRTVFAACALAFAPVLLAVGCDAEPPAARVDHAPLVLAELQQASPGPWRRLDAPVAHTSLERPISESFAPPAALDPAELDELKLRMSGEAPSGEHAAGEPTAQIESAVPPYDYRITDPYATPDVQAGEQRPRPEPITPAAPAPQEPAQPSVDEAAAAPRILAPPAAPRAVTSQRLPEPNLSLPAPQTPLPWATRTPLSSEMQAVLDQAEQRVKHGFRLAERGAMYLAREEFVSALELISQANDLARGTQFFTDSLDAGLTALAESRDFVQPRPIGKRIDLARIVSGHRTSVLKDEAIDDMPPSVAARRYYAYAQEQLAGAAAGEPRSSIALYGLGKTVAVAASPNPSERLEVTARAMVLYQSALMADRSNYRAANELGVILARNGDLPHARDLLAHSVRLSPHPVPYRNLAVVLNRLGDRQLAERAMGEAVALEQKGIRRSGPAVQWVDPATFAGSAPASNTTLPPVAQNGQPAAPAAEQKAPVSTANKGNSWLPWTRR